MVNIPISSRVSMVPPKAPGPTRIAPHVADTEEENEEAAIDAMEPYELVPDDGKELPWQEKADGDDCGEMREHADATAAVRLVFPVADRQFGWLIGVVVLEVHGSRGAET
jgi:hypothetical protein